MKLLDLWWYAAVFFFVVYTFNGLSGEGYERKLESIDQTLNVLLLLAFYWVSK